MLRNEIFFPTRLAITNVGKYVENKRLHPLLVQVFIDTDFSEGNLAILVKTLKMPLPNHRSLWGCGIRKG